MTLPDTAADRAAQLLDLIEGKWTTQAIGVAAELGIADLIGRGTNDLPSLAHATGCVPSSLHRLLKGLASLGLCVEEPASSFKLTPLGELLASDTEPSLHASAIWGARHGWNLWGRLQESVRSGESVRALAGQSAGYAHLEGDPAAASTFNCAMVELTGLIAADVSRAHDFSRAKRIVDVGGGYGKLLVALLGMHGHLRGVLFDLPHAIDGARARIEGSDLAGRCELVAGDFFKSVPAGADAYLLKSIAHNWDDERAAAILSHCRRAMPRHARVLLVERVMPERLTGNGADRRTIRADLNMLVSHSGRERTRVEFEALLAQCGLELRSIEALALGFCLIEASPA